MGEKVLITGGAGFIGSHLVEHFLLNSDYELIMLDRLNYAGDLNRVAGSAAYLLGKERVRFVYHDLRAEINERVAAEIGDVDYVIHMAAETHVDRSLHDAAPFAISNVVGTTHLLEWAKYQTLKKFFNFSTDEVHGAAEEGVFFKETDRYAPSNPYAASKAGQEQMGYAFAHAFGMPVVTVRCMNVFGERQHQEKFVPKTILAAMDNREIILHGKGKEEQASRCWIHARNVADAILFLMEKGVPKETYNIVGEERGVLEIAEAIYETLWGKPLPETQVHWIDFHNARKGHDRRYALDGSKLKELGWLPPLTIEASLKKAVEWEKEKACEQEKR